MQNDDVVMMMISSGQYTGEPSANLVFINYYLGMLYKLLYEVAPGVFWYPSAMLFSLCTCLAFIAMQAWTCLHGRDFWQLPLLLVVALLLLNFTLKMQFTTAAGAAVAIGSWSFFRFPDIFLSLISGTLIVFGFLLRFEAGALVLLVSAAMYLSFVAHEKPSKAVLGTFVGLLLASVFLEISGNAKYEELAPEYTEYNGLRGQINDNPNAKSIVSELPEGVSSNDYDLLLKFFVDPEVIDLKTISAISTTLGELEENLSLSDFLISVRDVLTQERILILLVLILLMLLNSDRLWTKICFFASFVMVLVLLSYIHLTAVLKDRVVYVAFTSILTASLLPGVPLKRNIFSLGTALVCLMLMILFGSLAAVRINETISLRSTFLASARLVSEWEGSVVIFGSAGHLESARVFSDDLLPLANKAVFAGWMAKHPNNQEYTDHAVLLHDQNALLISTDTDWEHQIASIAKSLEENHQLSTTYKVLGSSEGSQLVKFENVDERLR